MALRLLLVAPDGSCVLVRLLHSMHLNFLSRLFSLIDQWGCQRALRCNSLGGGSSHAKDEFRKEEEGAHGWP
jgi:hypothetical protein